MLERTKRIVLVGIKTDVATMKKSREVHLKLKIEPPYEPTISFLENYPKKQNKKRKPHDQKRDMHTHTHTLPHLTEYYLQ